MRSSKWLFIIGIFCIIGRLESASATTEQRIRPASCLFFLLLEGRFGVFMIVGFSMMSLIVFLHGLFTGRNHRKLTYSFFGIAFFVFIARAVVSFYLDRGSCLY